MIDCFLRLRHHVIIGSHNNDSNIRYFRTTCTHSGKRFVTRSIEERDTATVFQLHVICTDMLCNTSGFTGNYVRLTDIVEQRSLTVVNVSHHCNNRSARLQIFRSIFFFNDSLCHFRTYIFCLESELFCHQIDCFRIQTLVDRNHDTNTHTSSDNLIDRYIHHRCQFVSRNKLGQLQYLAVCHFLIFQFLHTVGSHFTFLLTVFGSLVLTFSGQTSQGFFYLFCYIFFTYFLFDNRLFETILVIVSSIIVVIVTLVITTIIITAFALHIRSRSCKVGSCNVIHIHLLFADTIPFFLVTGCIRVIFRSALSLFGIIFTDFLDNRFLHQFLLILADFLFFFTFTTFLFLRFLLRAS